MDLPEEMNIFESNISDQTGATTGSGYIKIEDAIIVAEKYTKEMCKKQRVICAESYRSEMATTDFTLELYSIENAPLATEE